MLSKRARPYDVDEDQNRKRRLGRNVEDLYASNTISANRAFDLGRDALEAGVGVGAVPRAVRLGRKNCAKKFKRHNLNSSLWPDVYWCKLRCWNKRDGREEYQWVAVHLIHEIADMLAKRGLPECYLSTESMDPASLAELDSAKLRESINTLLGLGIHGDGVPCNWDKSETCEVVSLNLPGVGGKWQNMRIPIFVMHHSMMTKGTWDDLMSLIAWSLRICMHGHYPAQRHDGTEWRTSDKRRKKSNAELLVRSMCCEIRGDWKFFNETFHLPQWSENAGICWDCNCTAGEVFLLEPCAYPPHIFFNVCMYVCVYVWLMCYERAHTACNVPHIFLMSKANISFMIASNYGSRRET